MPGCNAYRHVAAMIVGLFTLSLPIFPVMAAGNVAPPPLPPASKDVGKPAASGKASQKKRHRQEQRSERDYQQYVDGYRAARALVLDGKYSDAIAAFRLLGHDESPEVANYVGYAYRKLGDYDLSKVWYERALAADPNHVRTWEYYGLWHLEQGNKLKAQDFLEKIHLICGSTSCQEYTDLKDAIEQGRSSY